MARFKFSIKFSGCMTAANTGQPPAVRGSFI